MYFRETGNRADRSQRTNTLFEYAIELQSRSPYWGALRLTIENDHLLNIEGNGPVFCSPLDPMLDSDAKSFLGIVNSHEQIPDSYYAGGLRLRRTLVFVAMSATAIIQISFANGAYQQRYEARSASNPVKVSDSPADWNGIKCDFDPEMISTLNLDYASLSGWYASLENAPNVEIIDNRNGERHLLSSGS